MKKYTDPTNGKITVETGDLSYLSDREHRYNWFQRHFHHHRLRLALKNAEIVIVPDAETAVAVHHYYFVPKEKIVIRPLPQTPEWPR